jgi:hypothetical protein
MDAYERGGGKAVKELLASAVAQEGEPRDEHEEGQP